MMDGDPGMGGGKWARMCDSCRSAACAVYCRADTAYLCAGCDARIHAANRVASRHDRVWVCEACERSPAAVKCKADAAVLCTACDADIHSANPLARRHHRIPVPPILGLLYGPPTASANMVTSLLGPEEEEEEDGVVVGSGGGGDDEASSWLLLNPVKNSNQSNGYEVDEYLDFVEYNNENQGSDQSNGVLENHGKDDGNESVVVPVQFFATDEQQHQQPLQLDFDFEGSKTGSSYSASICHSVSYSSMEASVVPDMATMNDISNSHVRPPKGTIDLFSSNSIQMMPTQFTPMDREARVLRYREKRKTRKFEKTIRYASRKAYAETRPRIKGRFAKRTDVEVDQMFSATVIADSGFSIVPSY